MIRALLELRDVETEERLWILESNDYPHHSKPGPRRAVMDRILLAGDFGDSTEPIALDRYPDETRVELIGQNCKIHGRKWIKRNASEIDWLKSVGLSVERAIAFYLAKVKDISKDPFFTTANINCPKCKYRGRSKKKRGGRKWVPAFDPTKEKPICRRCGYVWKHERVRFKDNGT